MKRKRYFALILFLYLNQVLQAQKQIKITGTVTDEQSSELLSGASIWVIENNHGTATNTYGYYHLNTDEGKTVTLQVSYVGFETKYIKTAVDQDTILNIKLKSGFALKELNLTYFPNNQTIGRSSVSLSKLLNMPAIGGEGNIVSALKTLPGVSAGKEGSSELSVRGGDFYQNMILLDESPIYNLNHSFGLVSVFNTSTLKAVNLYKGAIPAKYGGSLSSVVDIATKDGNKQKYQGEFNLSTLAAALTVEGPIVKNKASFLFSARRSWFDLLLAPGMASSDDGLSLGLYFMDLNGKVNFSIKNKHHFYLSYYTGQDEMSIKLQGESKDQNFKSVQGWGNNLFSLRWNTSSKNGLFYQITTYYSSFYEYDKDINTISTVQNGQKNQSHLNEVGIKGSISWAPRDAWSFRAGAEGNVRYFQFPHKTLIQDNVISDISTGIPNKIPQRNGALFASSYYSLGKVTTELGLRGTITSETSSNFQSLEPRFSAKYQWKKHLSLKWGAMHNVQTLYAIRKSNNGFPGYVWIPTTEKIKPQTSWQVSTGMHWNYKQWNIDIEGYYKWLNNITNNYLHSSSVYPVNNWTEIIDQGKGRAYGLETLINYSHDKFNFSLAYTLAKVENIFPNINNGNWFPFDNDIRHDIDLTGACTIYKKNDRKLWLSTHFSLHSGIPVTLPSQSISSMLPLFKEDQYYFDFSRLDHYNYPNNSRMELYHRLDLSVHIEKKKRIGTRCWSLGIINAYNRQNPYLFYRSEYGTYKQVTLFPIMPFISYNRKF